MILQQSTKVRFGVKGPILDVFRPIMLEGALYLRINIGTFTGYKIYLMSLEHYSKSMNSIVPFTTTAPLPLPMIRTILGNGDQMDFHCQRLILHPSGGPLVRYNAWIIIYRSGMRGRIE